MSSPYKGSAGSGWKKTTERLVRVHPLSPGTIRESALSAWTALWQTTVGAKRSSIKLSELAVPATVVGYMFEVLFTREIERAFPGKWRRGRAGNEKDLVCLSDNAKSVEIKTSGQKAFRIYGNRSYAQKGSGTRGAKKAKSGFYITVNFLGQTVTLLRFGWIDNSDWKPQRSPTGQMAGLAEAAYRYKLLEIPGEYRKKTPVVLLKGVGQKTEDEFLDHGITTVADLLRAGADLPKKLKRIIEQNRSLLEGCSDASIDE
ncbi:MAG: ScaI family restriction endonuclease [Candidatus Nealsonbacteria bacterium]|nr:ScaI family restriction endonuclease [Candidatus Nealsonbacteria bacterium]